MIIFEPLEEKHRNAVIDVFNHYVTSSNFAYPEKTVDYIYYDRFLENARLLCGYAIINENGKTIGFCQLKPHSQLSTFNQTVEITYFLDPSSTGKGYGTIILDKLIQDAKRFGKKQIIASVSSDNLISRKFHISHGFKECGMFRKVGNKLGNDFDVVYFQREI